MEWKNNFSEMNLVLNSPVKFTLIEKDIIINSFIMKIPTINDIYCNNELQLIASIFNSDIQELNQQFPFIEELSTHFQLFRILLLYNSIPKINKYIIQLESALNYLGIPIKHNKREYYINNEEYIVDYNLFNEIQHIILVSSGLKKIQDYASVDPRYAKLQQRIKKIKGNGQNSRGIEDSNFLETLITISYEFGFTIEEMKQMNLFQINTYLTYIPRSINYKISLIAAGNGLTKKVKYITNKGR